MLTRRSIAFAIDGVMKMKNRIVDWIRDYADKHNKDSLIVGVSGGIDSAVTSTLCAKTGLPTLCVEMPIHQHINQVNPRLCFS